MAVAKTPAFFFGVCTAVLSDEISKAASAGVNLVSVEDTLPWSGSNTGIIQQVLEANPNAKILLRVNISPPSSYIAARSYPYALNDSGTSGTSPNISLASDTYIADVKKGIENMIRYFENSSVKDAIIGYHLAYQSGGEWFYNDTDTALWDYSSVNVTRFQSWCTAKYGTIAALNTAWGTAYGSFANVAIPTRAQQQAATDGVFRSPAAGASGNMRAIDYDEYHNKMTADRILEVNQVVKDFTTSRALTAAFFGYHNELTINGSHLGTPHLGHLGFRQVLASNAVDMITAPFSYADRGKGGSGGFPWCY